MGRLPGTLLIIGGDRMLVLTLLLCTVSAAWRFSCEGHCDSHYNSSWPCQCNTACNNHNDCCGDYSEFCDPDVITDAEIRQITSKLWSVDSNSVQDLVTMDIQGETTSQSSTDEAPNHLLSISPDAYLGPTISKFRTLFDNYDPDQKNPEDDTSEELEERDAFIDAILETQVMTELHLFLSSRHFWTRSGLRATTTFVLEAHQVSSMCSW